MRVKTIFVCLISLSFIVCASSQKKIEQARRNNPRYQYNLGLVHLNRGNVDEAITYLNRSLALDPDYYLALNALGLANFMKGNLREATKFLQRSVALNPSFSEARNNLGMVYQERGLLDKAQQEFRIAASDKNYDSRELPYYNLARLYLAQEKPEEALEYVNTALQFEKNLAMGHNLKGTIHEILDQLEEAVRSHRKAVKLDPLNLNFNFALAVALFKKGELDEAETLFKQLSTKATNPEMKDQIKQYLKLIKE